MNWGLLNQSLLLSASVALLSCAVGLGVALCFASAGRLLRVVLISGAISVLALPPFLMTNALMDVTAGGAFGKSALPFIGGFFGTLPFGLGTAIIVMAAAYWPVAALALWAAWSRLDSALIESDPCVRGWPFVRHVLLPLGGGALSVSGVITFVLALNNFSVASVLQVKTYPVELWIRYNTGLDWTSALAASWPLVIVPLILLVWVWRKGIPWPVRRGRLREGVLRGQLGTGWVTLGVAVTVAAFLVSLCFPLVQLVASAGIWPALPGATEASRMAARNSFVYAGSAAIICCAIGLLLAAYRHTQNLAPALWFFFFVPGTVLGIGLAVALARRGLEPIRDGIAAVVLVLVIRYLALAWGAAKIAIESCDAALLDVARLDGATVWQRIRHVYWPQSGRLILVGAYAVFLLALWEVECVLPVVPPGGDTLAMRIFNLLHYGHTPDVNALCLLLVGIALAPLAVYAVVRAARQTTTRITIAACLTCAAAGLSACSPAPTGANPGFESRIFSKVEIIGTKGAGLGQFTKPRSVAVDAHDNLYVADMTGRVQKFSPAGEFLLSWQMPQTDLGRPKGMCRDREGNIVVIEPHYSRVNHFNDSGSLVFQWGRHGTNRGELGFPRAAVVNSNGDIYVSEYGLFERVQRFVIEGRGSQKQARLAASFGSAGNKPGQFNRPEGLGIDSAGRVFVADSCNHRIQVFDQHGGFLSSFGKAGSASGQLSYPYDVAVDQSGLSFVCEFGNSRIQVFDADNAPLEIIGGPGSQPGRFNNPWSVALDSAGNLYVADSQNHRVQKLVRRS